MATKKKGTASTPPARKKTVQKKAGSKKASSKKTAKKSTTKKKTARKNSRGKTAATPVDASIRQQMIAEAAYFIAEQRGFKGGSKLEDWLIAEAQVDARLSKRGK